ncbi:MAG: hypothetical protein LBT95_03615 [Treponema sp.]|nr:hypothetical protein [Treponema sp.]
MLIVEEKEVTKTSSKMKISTGPAAKSTSTNRPAPPISSQTTPMEASENPWGYIILKLPDDRFGSPDRLNGPKETARAVSRDFRTADNQEYFLCLLENPHGAVINHPAFTIRTIISKIK